MPEPRTCNLRNTSPIGPMVQCEGLACYQGCLELTSLEREAWSRTWTTVEVAESDS